MTGTKFTQRLLERQEGFLQGGSLRDVGTKCGGVVSEADAVRHQPYRLLTCNEHLGPPAVSRLVPNNLCRGEDVVVLCAAGGYPAIPPEGGVESPAANSRGWFRLLDCDTLQ